MDNPINYDTKTKAVLEVCVDHWISAYTWEIIEDKIANAISDLGLSGEITNAVTGNSTHFQPK